MGVVHEVGGHLKGKADWIVRSNRVLHPYLIVLEQRHHHSDIHAPF